MRKSISVDDNWWETVSTVQMWPNLGYSENRLLKYDSSIVNKDFTLIAKDWGVISTIHMDDDGFPSEQQKDQG